METTVIAYLEDAPSASAAVMGSVERSKGHDGQRTERSMNLSSSGGPLT
jgi:hypothetical protein